MWRRKRYLIPASVVLLLVAAEVGFRWFRAPVACVRIVNQGGEPIENLRLTSGQHEATVATIQDGASATLYLPGRGKAALTVTFQQKNNPLSTFEIPTFDPAALQKEGFALVLVIRQNEYERYQDDGDPSFLSRLAAQTKRWLEKSLESP